MNQRTATDGPEEVPQPSADVASGGTDVREQSSQRSASGSSADEGAPGRFAIDPVDGRPGRTSIAVAVGTAIVASALLGPSSVATIVGLGGTALLAGGLLTSSRGRVTAGGVVLLGAVVIAAAAGAHPAAAGVATLLTVLAWDAGEYGITIGKQLGRTAATARIELAHVATSAAVGAAGLAVAYATFLVAGGREASVAIATVLVGVVLLLSAVRRRA